MIKAIKQTNCATDKRYFRLTPSELSIIKHLVHASGMSYAEMWYMLLFSDKRLDYLLDHRLFQTCIKRLFKKGILDISKKGNSSFYQLSNYGRLLWQYVSPPSFKPKDFTATFVSTKKAASELGLREGEIRKKKYSFFHYFRISKRLYVFKNIYTHDIRKQVPTFPLIPKDGLVFLLRFIPSGFLNSKIFKTILKETFTSQGWSWTTILRCCLRAGKYYPSRVVIKSEQKQNQ